MSSGSIVDSVRRPEYTGENRCTPCTIVNTAIAVALSVGVSAVLAVATSVGAPVAAAAGVVVFGVSAASIYLRGYLVPKTPELTKRYFPDRVLAWFDKAPEPGVGHGVSAEAVETGGTEPADGSEATTDEAEWPDGPDEDLQPELALLSAGAVEECTQVEDLCLTEAFETDWQARIREVREDEPDAETIASALSLPEIDGSVEHYGDAVVLRHEGRQIGKWESTAALVADVAAADLLADRYDDWADLNAFDRSRLLRGLRIFVETCPECDGPIALGQDTVESCCRSYDVVAVTCEECGSRLFEEQLQEGMA